MTHIQTLQALDPSIAVPPLEIEMDESGLSVGAFNIGIAEKEYIDSIRNMFSRNERVLVLTGPSGAGKTALFNQVAAMDHAPLVSLKAVKNQYVDVLINGVHNSAFLTQEQANLLSIALSGKCCISIVGDMNWPFRNMLAEAMSTPNSTFQVRGGNQYNIDSEAFVCFENLIDGDDGVLRLQNRKNTFLINLSARKEDGTRDLPQSYRHNGSIRAEKPNGSLNKVLESTIQESIVACFTDDAFYGVSPDELTNRFAMSMLTAAATGIAVSAKKLDSGLASEDDVVDFAVKALMDMVQNAFGGDARADLKVVATMRTLGLANIEMHPIDAAWHENIYSLAKVCWHLGQESANSAE